MTPDTCHAQHKEFSCVWKMCRDAAAGQRAIHAGRTAYLPKLDGQEEEEYRSYLKRAMFFNATGRTIDGMTGLVFRKPPTITVPPAMEEWAKDIDLAGKSLEGFSRVCFEETLGVGRGGILVDCPPAVNIEPGAAQTVEQARQNAQRPYLSFYKAEDIINWRIGRVGNVTMLLQIFLMETYENDSGEALRQIRELTMETGSYQQVVWKETDTGWVPDAPIMPVKDGRGLAEIPFFFLAPQEPDAEIQAPPVEDLVYVNLSHYMNSADLENGAHVSGLPTPYFTGVTDADAEIYLGTGTAIKLPDANCTAGFLQVGAEGFSTLEKLMDRKEQQMAALGARLIAPEKKQAETAETAQIRRGGENSVLASIAGAVEMQIQKALRYMADWGKIGGDVVFGFKKDFLPTTIDAQTLNSLLAAVQAGRLSGETFFEALQAGEIVSDTITYDAEKERISEDGPSLGAIGRANL